MSGIPRSPELLEVRREIRRRQNEVLAFVMSAAAMLGGVLAIVAVSIH